MNLIHTAFEPKGEGPFPAIVALHGWGASAFDLLGLAPYVCNGGFLMLCPQGSMELPLGQGALGYGWFPITMGGTGPADSEIETAVEAASAFVDEALKRYPINPSKLALLGFSQGGVMAYHLAIRQPQRFAVLAALSSWFPPELADKVTDRQALKRLPTMIQHGSRDEAINITRGRESVEKVRELGFPVVYREYDCGHEITAKGLRDLSQFLNEKVVRPVIHL